MILSFSFFHFLIFLFFHLKNGITPLLIATENGHEQIVQLLLEKGKPNVDFAKVFLLIVFFFFFFTFSFFTFSFFYFFFNVKDGVTPLYIASIQGHEQIVQILLEKGEPNVDLPTNKVLLLILSFFFLFFFSFSSFFF